MQRSPALDSAAQPPGGATAIRGGAIRVLGYGAGVLVSLGAAAVLVRHLGVAAFGRYVTVTSLIALVGGVSEAGISLYGIREFVVLGDVERRELMAKLLTVRLGLTLAGVAIAALFAITVGYSATLVIGALIVGGGLAVQIVADVLATALQAQLRLGRMAAVDFVRRVVALALIVALALLGAGLLPFFAVSAAAGLIALAIVARLVRSTLQIRLSFDRDAWRRLFAETLPFALAMSVGAIYFYVTVLVMSVIASATQTGLFATSFRVIQVILGVPILLLTAVFPLMSAGNDRFAPAAGGDRLAPSAVDDRLAPSAVDDRLAPSAVDDRLAPSAVDDRLAPSAVDDRLAPSAGGDRLAPSAGGDRLARSGGEDRLAPPSGAPVAGKVFDVALVCGAFMTVTVALGAGFIIELIAGGHGAGAASVLRIQSLMLTASFVSTASALGLIALRRYRPMMLISSAALSLDVTLSLALVPSLGARGGALADIVTEALVAVAMTFVLVRSVPRHGLTPAIVPAVALATALAAATALLPAGSLVHALAAAVVYIVVLAATKAIPSEVLAAARGAIPRSERARHAG